MACAVQCTKYEGESRGTVYAVKPQAAPPAPNFPNWLKSAPEFIPYQPRKNKTPPELHAYLIKTKSKKSIGKLSLSTSDIYICSRNTLLVKILKGVLSVKRSWLALYCGQPHKYCPLSKILVVIPLAAFAKPHLTMVHRPPASTVCTLSGPFLECSMYKLIKAASKIHTYHGLEAPVGLFQG
jgi:hypothetical protein